MKRVCRRMQLLAGALIVQVAGRALDFRWHANHDEFEATSQQLEAHWLLWLGVALTLIALGAALAVAPDRGVRLSLRIAFGSGLFYVPISVWHFIEHANHHDPSTAHVLLAMGQVGMLGGAVTAIVRWVRGARAPAR